MDAEFEANNILEAEFVAEKSGITVEIISHLIAAGILFPDEMTYAERILRRLNTKKY